MGTGSDEVFRTARTVVRHWRPSDADAVLSLYGDPDVARWTSTPEPLTELHQASERLEGWADGRDDDQGFGYWAVVVEGQERPQGIVLLRPLGDSGEVEIGWTIHPDVQGKGLATEAAAGVIAHARSAGHERIRAIMLPDNDASAVVCRRLGMRELGEIEDPWHGTAEHPTSRMFRLDLSGPASPSVRELDASETHRAHLAVAELRTAFAGDRHGFVARVDEVQRPDGYRLLAAFDHADDEEAGGVAGFRALRNLAWGDVLYVDDLSVRAMYRRRGHGAALLEAVAAEARRLGCEAVHLDSGHHRHDAHRLYLAQGYRMTSHHLALKLAGD